MAGGIILIAELGLEPYNRLDDMLIHCFCSTFSPHIFIGLNNCHEIITGTSKITIYLNTFFFSDFFYLISSVCHSAHKSSCMPIINLAVLQKRDQL